MKATAQSNEPLTILVVDDYDDSRLIMYDDLFADWENLLKFAGAEWNCEK